MSPALNESSAIWHFEGNDAIEICNGITLDFYMGLPHMHHSSPPYLFEVRVVGVYRVWDSMGMTSMYRFVVYIPASCLTMFSLENEMGVRVDMNSTEGS